jgi:hypothetical protein
MKETAEYVKEPIISRVTRQHSPGCGAGELGETNMKAPDMNLRAGEWVEVKTQSEVAQTLDADGTLDGLPFMPEMEGYCGRRFRVLRRAEKTCIEFPGGGYEIREFRGNDVFLLESLRCSGADHDGCQRQCTLFWKAAWLRKVGTGQPTASPNRFGHPMLHAKTRTMSTPIRYFCQSTELANATRQQPLTKMQVLQKCYRDVRFGGIRLREMIGLIAMPLYRKMKDRLFGRFRLLGRLDRTPVGTLGLHPGELVEIKSLKEMQETLDRRGRNRGLVCDIELKKFCGRQYRVRSRFDRMISESTGQMRTVEGTVILDGNTCMCARALGGCPRLDFCYWREVWLKRVGLPTLNDTEQVQRQPSMKD